MGKATELYQKITASRRYMDNFLKELTLSGHEVSYTWDDDELVRPKDCRLVKIEGTALLDGIKVYIGGKNFCYIVHLIKEDMLWVCQVNDPDDLMDLISETLRTGVLKP